MKTILDYFKDSEESYRKRFKNRPANISEMVQNTCALYPDKDALIFKNERITYRKLLNLVNSFSAILKNKYSIKPKDRIALLLPNCIDFAISYLAISQIAAISVTLNTRFRSNELIYIISNSQPKILIADTQLFNEIELFALKFFNIENIILTVANEKNRFVSFPALIKKGESEVFRFSDIKEGEIACLMYTSGTTGRPKGSLISHGNIIANSITLSIVYLCQENDIDLILAPLFHATGLFGQLLRSIYMGSTCVIEEKFNADMALKIIEKEKVTVCVAVPTIFWLMMIHPKFDLHDLSSLTRIIYGGAPATVNYIEQIKAKFPKAIQINAYGLTECTSIASALPHTEAIRKKGSIGLPVPGSEIKIVDENNNEVNKNIVGELIIRSPQVCQGYWEDADATKKSFKNGYLYTGDLAKLDDEGFIYLMDRKKNMIIRGGENIYSIELENVLYSYPKILEAAVVGVPDKIFGEQVKACIVLKSGDVVSEEEIRYYCNQHLADFKVPKYIEFYDELPRNPAGKVMKEKLK